MGQAFLLDGGLSYLIARRKGASSARAFNLASKRLRSAVPYVAAGGLGIGAYRGFRQVRSK